MKTKNISINIPKQLGVNCYHIVAFNHKKYGFKNLSKLLSSIDNFRILSEFDDSKVILNLIRNYNKIISILLIIGSIIIVLSFIINYWILLGLFVILFSFIFLMKQYKDYLTFLAARLLSIEFLINNLADWGTKYPVEQSYLNNMFDEFSINKRTFWLQYYIDIKNPDVINALKP
jgi:hypothetical protein